MRIVFLLTFSFLLTSCQQEKDELIGHWHSTSSIDGSYLTLDITDSTTQVNKYEYFGEWYPEFLRYHEETGEETFIFDFEQYKSFKLINDTLIINDQLKFLKVDEKYHLNDRFPNSLVHLNLPKSTKFSEAELPYKKSQLSHIYIGPPKETEMQSELINSDSTCFQILDFIATGYIDLEMFARLEDEKLHEDENYWLIIHADSTTTQTTIDTLLTLLEPLGVVNGFILSKYNYKLDRIEYEELKSR